MKAKIALLSVLGLFVVSNDAAAQYRFGFAPQPRYVAQPRIYGPMAGSTPMMVPRSPGIPYGYVATRAARAATGAFMISRGATVTGGLVRGYGGILFYPGCAGEGCPTGWQRHLYGPSN